MRCILRILRKIDTKRSFNLKKDIEIHLIPDLSTCLSLKYSFLKEILDDYSCDDRRGWYFEIHNELMNSIRSSFNVEHKTLIVLILRIEKSFDVVDSEYGSNYKKKNRYKKYIRRFQNIYMILEILF